MLAGDFTARATPPRIAYTFTGRDWDSEAKLYFYRARYYSPVAGRFLEEDPLGFTAGRNYFGYVGNSPTNLVDPFGLYSRQIIYNRAEELLTEGGGWNWIKAAGIVTGDAAFNLISLGNWAKNDRLLDRNLSGEISDLQFYGGIGKNTAVGIASVAVGAGAGSLVTRATGSFIAAGAASGFAQSTFGVLGDRGGDSLLGICHEGSAGDDAKSIALATGLGAGFGAAARFDATKAFGRLLKQVEAANFNTPRDDAVFWTGYELGNKTSAMEWATANGKYTIEMTMGGKWLERLNLYGPSSQVSVSEANSLWGVASDRFTSGASGNVSAFTKGTSFNSNKVFYGRELPGLRSNRNVNPKISYRGY